MMEKCFQRGQSGNEVARFEERHELKGVGGMTHENVLGEEHLRQCKGPQTGMGSTDARNDKEAKITGAG